MNARNGMSDIESEELVATLSLAELQAAEGSRKGKSREDAALMDEEVALDIQTENLETFLATLQDYRIAQSIDEADAATLLGLIMVNQGERDDHLAALALSRGGSLPPPTRSQRLLESTEVLSEFGSTTTNDIDIAGVVEPDIDETNEGGEPSHLLRHGGRTAAPKTMDCVICGDLTRHSPGLYAPCSHWYCQSCLLNLVEASTWDEKLHPLSCCCQPLPVASVLPLLPLDLRSRFHQKSTEFETPPNLWFYCPNQACSAFLGSSSGRESEITCTNCDTRACSACKNPAHTDENCAENPQTLVVKSLASKMGWQTCPSCRAIVELWQGCYHMICQCSTQFCYLCAAPWKTCDCRLWDDKRLLNEGERIE